MVGNITFVALIFGLADKTPSVKNFVSTPIVTFAAALAGWIIAIPLILMINNISGWRFWLYLGIGTSSGPIIVFAGLLGPTFRYMIRSGDQITAAIYVTVIALGFVVIPFFVGTLTYLLWLRKAQIGALKQVNLNGVNR